MRITPRLAIRASIVPGLLAAGLFVAPVQSHADTGGGGSSSHSFVTPLQYGCAAVTYTSGPDSQGLNVRLDLLQSPCYSPQVKADVWANDNQQLVASVNNAEGVSQTGTTVGNGNITTGYHPVLCGDTFYARGTGQAGNQLRSPGTITVGVC